MPLPLSHSTRHRLTVPVRLLGFQGCRGTHRRLAVPCGDITRRCCGRCAACYSSRRRLTLLLRRSGRIGHLLRPHGDFARPSGSLVLSFARRPGVLFAQGIGRLCREGHRANRSYWAKRYGSPRRNRKNMPSAALMALRSSARRCNGRTPARRHREVETS